MFPEEERGEGEEQHLVTAHSKSCLLLVGVPQLLLSDTDTLRGRSLTLCVCVCVLCLYSSSSVQGSQQPCSYMTGGQRSSVVNIH